MGLHTYTDLYFKLVPLMIFGSTISGIHTGIKAIEGKPTKYPFNNYSALIGYTSIGIITGITYPISFPFFGGYVLYKFNRA